MRDTRSWAIEADNRVTAAAICLLYGATQIGLSLRFLASTSQSVAFLNPAKPLLGAALAVCVTALLHIVLRAPPVAARLLRSPLLCAALLAALACALWLLYPLLDRESVRLAGEGSDADDALIDAAMRLIAGAAPYAAPTYRGNPISTGIGWVILNLPLATKATFFLLTPVWLSALALTLRAATGTWIAANIAVLAQIGCLGFLEMAPTTDLPAFAAALAAVFIAAYMCRGSWGGLIVVAALMGVIASGRVPFLPFPLVAAVLLWRASAGRSLILALVGLAAAACCHLAALYFSDAPYQPLHLLLAPNALTPGGWRYVSAAATIATAALAWTYRDESLSGLLLRFALCLSTPLGIAAVTQLIVYDRPLGDWEGANYLAPVLPLLAAALGIEAARRTAQPDL